jgi:phage gp29-like protein
VSADIKSMPLPQTEEIVTNDILTARQYTTLSLAKGFAGTADPTVIWQSMISDQQQAFNYYRELEEKDDDVAGDIEAMKLAILRRKQTVAPADDSSQAVEIAQFIEEMLCAIPNCAQVFDALMDAPAYGLAISEILWDVSSGQVGVSAIKDRPQELFCFNPRYLPQIGPLRFLKSIYDVTGGELVPENKFLIFTYRPRNGGRRGRPLLRATFWLSWFKRQALRMWLRFGEKGPGTAAVKYPQGANADEQQKALAAAEAIVEKIAIAVPDNFGLVQELLTGARTQNPAVYENLVDRCAMAITRRILGQTLTSHGSDQGAGSFALGQVHGDTFNARQGAIAVALESVVNDQLVKPLVLWNFGPEALKIAPKWTVDMVNAEDLVQRSQVDYRLQAMGTPIPKEYVQKKYGIPEPAPDDEVLVPAASGNPNSPQRGDRLPVDDPADAAFSDEKRVKRETSDIDRLVSQLQDAAFPIYRQRVLDLVGKGGATS